jgi:hypothetical protein
MLEWVLSGPLGLVQVVEYPKCGGSWIRNMIRTYKGVSLFINDRFLRKNDVVMSHRLYSRKYKRPIVVVRDPRDMYVSYYYFQTSYQNRDPHSNLFKYFHHDPNRNIREDFYDYLKAKLFYASHPWFYYSQFLDNWLSRPGVCVIRFEDCLSDPEGILIRILRFLDEPIDFNLVTKTVAATSFQAITKEKYGESRNPGEEDNAKFHRKGIAGDWKMHFTKKSCQLIEKLEGSSLRRLGYEKDAGWIEKFLHSKS